MHSFKVPTSSLSSAYLLDGERIKFWGWRIIWGWPGNLQRSKSPEMTASTCIAEPLCRPIISDTCWTLVKGNKKHWGLVLKLRPQAQHLGHIAGQPFIYLSRYSWCTKSLSLTEFVICWSICFGFIDNIGSFLLASASLLWLKFWLFGTICGFIC